jgi:predicted GNAT family N-acyltransferase
MRTDFFTAPPPEAMDIRIRVFVEEQGFYDEFDDTDNVATHLLIHNDDGLAVATCRVFPSEAEERFYLGRLAVLKEYRGKGFGSQIVTEAEKHLVSHGCKEILLHSQLQATPFYERLGYTQFGEIENDQGQPHIWMKKELK